MQVHRYVLTQQEAQATGEGCPGQEVVGYFSRMAIEHGQRSSYKCVGGQSWAGLGWAVVGWAGAGWAGLGCEPCAGTGVGTCGAGTDGAAERAQTCSRRLCSRRRCVLAPRLPALWLLRAV